MHFYFKIETVWTVKIDTETVWTVKIDTDLFNCISSNCVLQLMLRICFVITSFNYKFRAVKMSKFDKAEKDALNDISNTIFKSLPLDWF